MFSKHSLWWISCTSKVCNMPLRKGEAEICFCKLCTLAVWYCDPAHLECKLIYTEPQIGLKMDQKVMNLWMRKVILHTLKRSTARKRIMGKAKQYW